MVSNARWLLARWLVDNRDYVVLIEGHTDSRGTREDRHAIAELWAKAAASFLASMGLPDAPVDRQLRLGPAGVHRQVRGMCGLEPARALPREDLSEGPPPGLGTAGHISAPLLAEASPVAFGNLLIVRRSSAGCVLACPSTAGGPRPMRLFSKRMALAAAIIGVVLVGEAAAESAGSWYLVVPPLIP